MGADGQTRDDTRGYFEGAGRVHLPRTAPFFGDATRWCAGVDDAGVNHQPARRRQACRGVRQTSRLFVTVGHVEQGVVGNEDEVEGLVGLVVYHVTEHRSYTVLRVFVGQTSEHLRRLIHTNDTTARRYDEVREGECHAPSTDAQFKHADWFVRTEQSRNRGEVVGVAVPVVIHIGKCRTVGRCQSHHTQ